MKFGWVLPVLLLMGLLLAPSAAANAASDAALLWWTRVLPSLLPYLVATVLLERSRLIERAPRRAAPLLLWLFGALGGYPIGARLSQQCLDCGMLTEADARRAAVFCNLPNPNFLISVVALGMFQSARVLPPLLLGVYGVAAFGLLPLFRMQMRPGTNIVRGLSADDLPKAIETGVRTILIIGGCMIFASVLGALIASTGVERLFGAGQDASHAVLLGLFEMTCGIRAVSACSLPLAVRLAVCAFFVQFGGCSVLLQSAANGPVSLSRYALSKGIFALISALLTLVLTPVFCPDGAVPTLASRTEIVENTATLLSVLLSAAIGLLAVFVLTFGLQYQEKKTP